MRNPSIDNMSDDLLDSLTKGMNSLFSKYFKNSSAIALEDISTYAPLYNGLHSDNILIDKIPYSIKHASDVNIYTLECTEDGVRYIPNMLIGNEGTVLMTSVKCSNKFVSNLLGLLLEKILGGEHNIAQALLRTVQTISALNGEFQGYEIKEDNTRYNSDKYTMSRRTLR